MDPNTIATPVTPTAAPSCGTSALQRMRVWVPIRTLGERHRVAVRAHLLALDAHDRQLRFGYALSDERLQAYAAQLDFERDQIFGTFDRRLRLVALGHMALGRIAVGHMAVGHMAVGHTASGHTALGTTADTDSASGHGELGLSVLSLARGRGLGTRLFEHAVMHGRNRGVHTLHIHLARENMPMLAIVQRAGAHIDTTGSEALAVLPLAGETLGTQIGELLGERAAALDFRLKVQTLREPTPSQGPV